MSLISEGGCVFFEDWSETMIVLIYVVDWKTEAIIEIVLMRANTQDSWTTKADVQQNILHCHSRNKYSKQQQPHLQQQQQQQQRWIQRQQRNADRSELANYNTMTSHINQHPWFYTVHTYRLQIFTGWRQNSSANLRQKGATVAYSWMPVKT